MATSVEGLFEQIGPEGVVQTECSFDFQGHQRSIRMVPLDRKRICLHFLYLDHVLSHIVLELWQKYKISENEI